MKNDRWVAAPGQRSLRRKAKGTRFPWKPVTATAAIALVVLAIVGAGLLLWDDLPGGGSRGQASARVQALTDAPLLTAQEQTARYAGYGAHKIYLAETQINQPGVCGTEIIFSAGSGEIGGNVLTRVYRYNTATDEEIRVASTKVYNGEFYETLINEKYMVWVETDHGTNNNIYVYNRENETKRLLKRCTNGKPKLRLDGDILIWMEQNSDSEDALQMIDLESEENLSLFTFTDVATYGVSAPSIWDDNIAWVGPDESQSEEERETHETSTIHYFNLTDDVSDDGMEIHEYSPGTYVHEPIYDGTSMVWMDSNKAFTSNLYLAKPGDAAPQVIAEDITTYGMGDGIVVYGKDQSVWVYVIATGETVRLTTEGERGILPQVDHGRMVVWYGNTENDGDVLYYKHLTDEDLGVQ